MKPLVILTSALNTKFGVHTTEQRMAQTLDSVNSIKKYCPGAKIAIVEMGGIPITESQLQQFYLNADYVINFCDDENLKTIFNSTENWDVVKNTTEVMMFPHALRTLIDNKEIDKFDRVFKMSGRYQLTEHFNPAYYDTVPDRIVVLQRKGSQFPIHITGGLTQQYMSRLWSWPSDKTEDVINSYSEGFQAMARRIYDGGYFDIEHMLFAYSPKELVTEIPRVGLRGLLGPNGVAIED